MAMLVVLAIVAVVVIALALDRLGYADGKTVRRIEWFRKRGAAIWWITVGAVMIATGIPMLQLAGFLVLLYMAILAVGPYDVDANSVRRNARTAWRKLT